MAMTTTGGNVYKIDVQEHVAPRKKHDYFEVDRLWISPPIESVEGFEAKVRNEDV